MPRWPRGSGMGATFGGSLSRLQHDVRQLRLRQQLNGHCVFVLALLFTMCANCSSSPADPASSSCPCSVSYAICDCAAAAGRAPRPLVLPVLFISCAKCSYAATAAAAAEAPRTRPPHYTHRAPPPTATAVARRAPSFLQPHAPLHNWAAHPSSPRLTSRTGCSTIAVARRQAPHPRPARASHYWLPQLQQHGRIRDPGLLAFHIVSQQQLLLECHVIC